MPFGKGKTKYKKEINGRTDGTKTRMELLTNESRIIRENKMEEKLFKKMGFHLKN